MRRTWSGSCSSFMTLTEPARPLEVDAENPSPDGRSATGRETLRLGGVMTSEGPESMFCLPEGAPDLRYVTLAEAESCHRESISSPSPLFHSLW